MTLSWLFGIRWMLVQPWRDLRIANPSHSTDAVAGHIKKLLKRFALRSVSCCAMTNVSCEVHRWEFGRRHLCVERSNMLENRQVSSFNKASKHCKVDYSGLRYTTQTLARTLSPGPRIGTVTATCNRLRHLLNSHTRLNCPLQ
jgi:hypothetical protein